MLLAMLSFLAPQFLKEVFPSTGQSVLAIINSSLSSGVVLADFKHAVVQLPNKKPSLDRTVLVSHFICWQIKAYLHAAFNLKKDLGESCLCPVVFFLDKHEVFQSGF